MVTVDLNSESVSKTAFTLYLSQSHWQSNLNVNIRCSTAQAIAVPNPALAKLVVLVAASDTKDVKSDNIIIGACWQSVVSF